MRQAGFKNRIAALLNLGGPQTKQKFLDPVQSRLRFSQPFEREVELFSIPDRDQKISDRQRVVTLVQKIAKRIEVPFGLGHLLAVDKQVFAVDPETNEWAAGRSLTLGNLVFMMRKEEIDPAAMKIERLAKVLHRHCRTFKMPARTAFAKRGWPAGFPRILRCLPQDEIAGFLLFVFVRIDASAHLQFSLVESGKAAIGRKSRNAIVNRIPLPIRITRRQKAIDQINHLPNVLGRRRDDFRLL